MRSACACWADKSVGARTPSRLCSLSLLDKKKFESHDQDTADAARLEQHISLSINVNTLCPHYAETCSLEQFKIEPGCEWSSFRGSEAGCLGVIERRQGSFAKGSFSPAPSSRKQEKKALSLVYRVHHGFLGPDSAAAPSPLLPTGPNWSVAPRTQGRKWGSKNVFGDRCRTDVRVDPAMVLLSAEDILDSIPESTEKESEQENEKVCRSLVEITTHQNGTSSARTKFDSFRHTTRNRRGANVLAAMTTRLEPITATGSFSPLYITCTNHSRFVSSIPG